MNPDFEYEYELGFISVVNYDIQIKLCVHKSNLNKLNSNKFDEIPKN